MSFGSMDSLNSPFLANKYTNLPTNGHCLQFQPGSIREQQKQIPISILISFPGVRYRVINVTEGVHAHYVVVCWKEKGSYCGAEMALFWSVLRSGWHGLWIEVLVTSGLLNIFALHFYFDFILKKFKQLYLHEECHLGEVMEILLILDVIMNLHELTGT